MGRFADCKITVDMGDGDVIETLVNSCVIHKLLEDGADEAGLRKGEVDRVAVVSIGPWDNVPRDDPAQDYGLVTLRNPHRFRLIRKDFAAKLEKLAFEDAAEE